MSSTSSIASLRTERQKAIEMAQQIQKRREIVRAQAEEILEERQNASENIEAAERMLGMSQEAFNQARFALLEAQRMQARMVTLHGCSANRLVRNNEKQQKVQQDLEKEQRVISLILYIEKYGQFPFERLPPEIKAMIIRMLIPSGCAIRRIIRLDQELQWPLLGVSRSLYDLTATIIGAKNTLVVSDQIPEKMGRYFRQVIVQNALGTPLLRSLQKCPKLKGLLLDPDQSCGPPRWRSRFRRPEELEVTYGRNVRCDDKENWELFFKEQDTRKGLRSNRIIT